MSITYGYRCKGGMNTAADLAEIKRPEPPKPMYFQIPKKPVD